MANHKKQTSSFSSLGGLVYSTDQILQEKIEDAKTLPNSQQNLRVSLDRKSGGKLATLITGFVGNERDKKDLEKKLKNLCATGGSSKDEHIILQGDVCQKVITYLQKEGYKVKRSGG